MAPLGYGRNFLAATSHPLVPEESLSPEKVLWAPAEGASLAAGWRDYGRLEPRMRADLTLWEGRRSMGRVYRGKLDLI
ncbi:hypothetical protein [Thermus thermamylovorans]|uniref:hypothetical protein n=1 Tax=Thermus thermamylovorans TaxID=2509362 RepID=UPI001F309ECC|nr:hypothetical protein [Thermus thermamylovorans]